LFSFNFHLRYIKTTTYFYTLRKSCYDNMTTIEFDTKCMYLAQKMLIVVPLEPLTCYLSTVIFHNYAIVMKKICFFIVIQLAKLSYSDLSCQWLIDSTTDGEIILIFTRHINVTCDGDRISLFDGESYDVYPIN